MVAVAPQPDLVTGFSEQASHKRVPFLLFPFCVNLKYPPCVISTPGPFDFPEIITWSLQVNLVTHYQGYLSPANASQHLLVDPRCHLLSLSPSLHSTPRSAAPPPVQGPRPAPPRAAPGHECCRWQEISSSSQEAGNPLSLPTHHLMRNPLCSWLCYSEKLLYHITETNPDTITHNIYLQNLNLKPGESRMTNEHDERYKHSEPMMCNGGSVFLHIQFIWKYKWRRQMSSSREYQDWSMRMCRYQNTEYLDI